MGVKYSVSFTGRSMVCHAKTWVCLEEMASVSFLEPSLLL